jgi:HSP20 family protein
MFEPVEFEPLSEFVPAIDLSERNGVFLLECSLPGYRREDIAVDVRPDMVTISGSYSRAKESDDSRYHQRELRRGSFVRSTPLPQDVDEESAKATFKDGMLRIELRPSKATKGKTVPIGE